MNLFKVLLSVNGFPIKKASEDLKEIQKLSGNNFSAYNEKMKWEIVNYHFHHTPYYSELVGNSLPTTWQKLPVMTKQDLQAPLASRLSNQFTKANVYVNKTSGSSGHPFTFAKDKYCHALTWARVMNWYVKEGIEVGKSLEARFYGIPLDTIGNSKERIKDFIGKRVRFPIFDLSENKLNEFLKTFQSKPFEYINGYTSSLVLFAKFLASKGIKLTSICPSLRICIVTSEMLFENDRLLLEEHFGVPVLNEYGASEFGIIGFSKSSGPFILDCETLFVEVVDENNMPVADGTPGRVIITSLYNKAHPMIRYDIGDQGILEKSNDVEGYHLKKLIGRTNDVAILPEGKQVPGLTFYYVTKSIIEDDSNVTEFVVRQKDIQAFEIIYVSKNPLLENELNKISRSLEKYVGSGLSLKFKRVDVLKRGKRGKLKQFIRDF